VKDCVLIQEQISWDRQLPEEIQLHVLNCEGCSRVAAEFASLDSWMAEHLDASIPDGFANMVMARIAAQPYGRPDTAWLPTRPGRILSSPWIQLGLVAAGSAIAILNLIRFVLAVMLPVLT
jgi:hypothetical protein